MQKSLRAIKVWLWKRSKLPGCNKQRDQTEERNLYSRRPRFYADKHGHVGGQKAWQKMALSAVATFMVEELPVAEGSFLKEVGNETMEESAKYGRYLALRYLALRPACTGCFEGMRRRLRGLMRTTFARDMTSVQ